MMTPELFFDLFLEDIKANSSMQGYYKFLGSKASFHFRRNYFLERLRYVEKNIINISDGNIALNVWDCGCGYGTTCFFLAMNGIKTYGTTLEFYYDTVQKRKEYWGNYGDASLFTCAYSNLFDNAPEPGSYDWIIVQDTLHHLEPIHKALEIFNTSLKRSGKILSIEENGNNLIQRAKLYKYRGNRRIIETWDEKLQKNILIGNENIRSLGTWKKILEKNGFTLCENSVHYIRYFLPFHYRFITSEKLIQKEHEIEKKSRLRREYFFFGINFVAVKNPQNK